MALAAVVAAAPPRATSAPLAVSGLQCEGRVNPLGVDGPHPLLGWQLDASGRGRRQSAWQVVVATDAAKLDADHGDLWDSGRTASSETVAIAYAGATLASTQQVFWKVRVWDENGQVSSWSPPATWTMGLLSPGDWAAQWITNGPFVWWDRTSAGYRSQDATQPATVKWLEIDLGTPQPIDGVRLYPLPYGVAAGFGFPARFKLELASNADRSDAVAIADFTAQDYRNPGTKVVELAANGRVGRYLRLTATQLAMDAGHGCLALSQVEVFSQGRNVAEGAEVRASDSREDGGWSARSVTDGLAGSAANPYANATLLLRREFAVRPGLRRALVFVCGLGDCELTVNGKRADDDLLSPGWTDYRRTRLYATREITPLLRTGPNALGLELAGGMFNVQAGRYVKFVTPYRPVQAIAQLRLEYQDGSVEIVGTGPDWKARLGPTTFANVYGGEDFDARLVPNGWDKAGFDDHDWTGVSVVDGGPAALRGTSFAAAPVRRGEEIRPVAAHPTALGQVYDLGQNAALIPRLLVHGPAGSVVRIVPAELLAPDGTLDRSTVGQGDAYWQYTLRGDPVEESWEPWTFYHGCRYLLVQCLPAAGGAPPVVDSMVARVVTAATVTAGDFACSNPLFNRIQTLVRWAQQNNTVSVLTDCPHRERLGWLEQTHLNGPALRYDFDLNLLFGKIARDIRDAQGADGFVPDIAPEYVRFADGFRDSPEWGSAAVLVPWQSYEWTGNATALRAAYASMKAYVAYLATRVDARGLLDFGLGDWFDLGPGKPGKAQLTPPAVTATAYFYRDTCLCAAAAKVLGLPAAAQDYASQAERIAAAFNRAFFNAPAGSYATGSQCSDAIALDFGLVPAAEMPRVQAALLADIRQHGDSFTAGDVGYEALLRALATAGRSDVIYAMNNQSSRPGYGYQLAHGATSLTEAWDSAHGSQDHFMLGQINEWLYHDLAGIGRDEDQPGFQGIVIRPAIVGDLTWVRAHYHSVRGEIGSEWQRDGSRLTLEVEIPCNTAATIYVPNPRGGAVTDGSTPVQFEPGITFRRNTADATVFAVGSGHYRFITDIGPLPPPVPPAPPSLAAKPSA